jgi:hypothetical protein
VSNHCIKAEKTISYFCAQHKLGTQMAELLILEFCSSGPLKKGYTDTLPENKSLPSVKLLAECFFSDTRQRSSLPSVRESTLGKEKTLGKDCFAECQI